MSLVVTGKTAQRMAATAQVLADWSGRSGRRRSADVAHTVNHHRARQATFGTVAARDRAQAIAGPCAGRRPTRSRSGEPPGTVRWGRAPYSSTRRARSGRDGSPIVGRRAKPPPRVAELEPAFVMPLLRRATDHRQRSWVGIEQIQLGSTACNWLLTELMLLRGAARPGDRPPGEVAAAVVAGALTRPWSADRHPRIC